jgi:hypothetical protein
MVDVLPEGLMTYLEPNIGSNRKLAYIPLNQISLDKEMQRYSKIKFTKPSLKLDSGKNFNELVFFMNSVFRVPIFNGG